MYKVLIVDDEPLILKGFDALLPWEEFGIALAYKASSGEEALGILQRREVDILITDIKMPGMDGLELIERVRGMGLTTRIIILSGYDDFQLIKRAVFFGIENYLLKPIEEEELKGTLLGITQKLDEERRSEASIQEGCQLLRENILIRWVSGFIADEELMERAELLNLNLDGEFFLAARATVSAMDTEPFSLRRTAAALCEGTRLLAAPGPDGKLALVFSWNGDEMDTQACAQLLERRAAALGVRLTTVWGSVERERDRVAASFKSAAGQATAAKAGSYNPFIDLVVAFVTDHLQEELSLKTLAQKYRVNAAYLGQLFKKSTGELFSAYVARERIELAKRLLAETDLKASEVALRAGYVNNNYFSNQFKRLTGLYPTEYRRKGRTIE